MVEYNQHDHIFLFDQPLIPPSSLHEGAVSQAHAVGLLQGCMNVFLVYTMLPDDSRRNALPRFCYDPRPVYGQSLFFDALFADSYRLVGPSVFARASDKPFYWTDDQGRLPCGSRKGKG
jgi:hypothetical protein